MVRLGCKLTKRSAEACKGVWIEGEGKLKLDVETEVDNGGRYKADADQFGCWNELLLQGRSLYLNETSPQLITGLPGVISYFSRRR